MEQWVSLHTLQGESFFTKVAVPDAVINLGKLIGPTVGSTRRVVDFFCNIMYINDMNNDVNLNAVFWDLPKFKDQEYLRNFLKEQKDKIPYYWAMTRFLRYGRIVDTFKFFDIKEINQNLDKLQLPEPALKRWKRMIEVYG